APGGVELLDQPDARWWAVAHDDDPAPAERAARATPPTVFVLLPGVGVVRAAVVEDHLHLSRLVVASGARRRGHATGLVAAAAAWGVARGARWAVLEVTSPEGGLPDVPARGLAERLGCTEHHRHHYLVAVDDAHSP
ncbi:MAG: GNAT family N-acetyltransferase, partial [Pseudonocardia sp.]